MVQPNLLADLRQHLGQHAVVLLVQRDGLDPIVSAVAEVGRDGFVALVALHEPGHASIDPKVPGVASQNPLPLVRWREGGEQGLIADARRLVHRGPRLRAHILEGASPLPLMESIRWICLGHSFSL